MQWDATQASIRVFTGREGALGPKGHDLEIGFDKFQITYLPDGGNVQVVLHTDSVHLYGSVHDGVLDPNELSESDKKKITTSIRESVLCVQQYPVATFEADHVALNSGDTVRGTLMLCGVKQVAVFNVTRTEGSWVGTTTVLQTDYRIKIFKAFLGALRVKNAVRIEVRIPIPVG